MYQKKNKRISKKNEKFDEPTTEGDNLEGKNLKGRLIIEENRDYRQYIIYILYI